MPVLTITHTYPRPSCGSQLRWAGQRRSRPRPGDRRHSGCAESGGRHLYSPGDLPIDRGCWWRRALRRPAVEHTCSSLDFNLYTYIHTYIHKFIFKCKTNHSKVAIVLHCASIKAPFEFDGNFIFKRPLDWCPVSSGQCRLPERCWRRKMVRLLIYFAAPQIKIGSELLC